jgi:glycerol-3-phosphate cytidylyltransferase
MIIGFTSGVFDLFHVGHLRLLEKAKKNCDFLIVGVCSDKLSKSLKHKRPVVSCVDRCDIVSALRCVDQVIVKKTDDDVYYSLQFNANLVFKGSDWANSLKWKRYEREFKAHNISVVFFPYTKRISSTKIRGKLNG